jgi:hypothetical protein
MELRWPERQERTRNVVHSLSPTQDGRRRKSNVPGSQQQLRRWSTRQRCACRRWKRRMVAEPPRGEEGSLNNSVCSSPSASLSPTPRCPFPLFHSHLSFHATRITACIEPPIGQPSTQQQKNPTHRPYDPQKRHDRCHPSTLNFFVRYSSRDELTHVHPPEVHRDER